MPSRLNYYDLLGLPRDATPEEIRRAYHEAARRLHPDVNKDIEATELFLQAQKAYDILIDPLERSEYDQKLSEENKEPVITEILFSRPAIPIVSESQLLYALLDFSAIKKMTSQPDPPLNVCLILDRSTSMQGERMDMVKMAAIELVRQLRPEDTISIVAFSDRADVLVPAGVHTDRKAIETRIRMLHPGGGTEIFQGLEAGYTEVHRFSGRTFVNHIILLTDGRTYGDEDASLRLADQAATLGIRITGLGIGTEWNDVFLDDLTARTGGSSTYIPKARDIQSLLKDKFSSLNKIYAEQVSLDLELGSGININSIYRLQPDASVLPANSPVRLGWIPKTSKLSIFIEFVVPPIPADSSRVTLASGELKLSILDKNITTHTIPIRLTRLTCDTVDEELPPRPIFQALSQITLFRMQERARKEISEGKVQAASQRMQRLATQLIAVGEEDLARTAMIEAEHIQQTHTLSAEGEKEIKYGTRALLLHLPARIEREEIP